MFELSLRHFATCVFYGTELKTTTWEKPCHIALDFDTVLQEQIVSSAPQVVGSFSLLEEFHALVYNPSLTLYHCILVIKPSRVSVGECDSMSRMPGSVKTSMMSRAFARRPDGLLSSGFQVRAQRVSIARSEITLQPLGSRAGLPLNFHALQEFTFLCR